MEMTPHPYLETPGSVLIFYNEWTGWEDQQKIIHQSMTPWPPERAPAVGDRFWMNEDPLHPYGKVYGYLLYQIEGLDRNRVYCDGGNWFAQDWFFARARLIKAGSHQHLADFLEQNPQSRLI
jgi:hypothetical protein